MGQLLDVFTKRCNFIECLYPISGEVIAWIIHGLYARKHLQQRP